MSTLLGTILAKTSRLLLLLRGRVGGGRVAGGRIATVLCTSLVLSFRMLSLRLRIRVALGLSWVGLFESPSASFSFPEL